MSKFSHFLNILLLHWLILFSMPLSAAQLQKLAPNAKPGWVQQLAQMQSDGTLASYGVDTKLRYNHFLAQVMHETGGLYFIVEAGSKAYFKRYEGRKDIGNIYPGDGYKYRGRGPTQITGRENYQRYGKILGVDLENNPDLAATPEIGWKLALIDWKYLKLANYADKDDIKGLTKKLNGGYNGFEDRKKWYAKIKQINN